LTIRVLPETRVVKIGGQSIVDRGADALLPVLDEIADIAASGFPILICAGGGTRARSIYSLAVELRLPVGMLASLGARVPIQNARMIQTYLASRGGVFIDPTEFAKLPMLFQAGCIPIMGGMPPYGFWEMQDAFGSRVPPHRTDSGTYLTAEYLGCDRALFVKDENGLYTDDPKRNPKAERIPAITAARLAEMDIADVVIERAILDYLRRAVWCREVQIVNGLARGEITEALIGGRLGGRGRNGSIISAE
jgi:molybdenum storage protein